MTDHSKTKNSGNHPTEVDTYDRGIIPAETAARHEREAGYKETPDEMEKPDKEHVDTTGGYTVDKEGLADNFPVEPEMYYEERGDLREKEEAQKAAREEELHRINENDESGKLTMEEDKRGKGPGVI